jgi:hypothetical protein
MSNMAEHLNDWKNIAGASLGADAITIASASPLGVISMGAFPASLIALGRLSRRRFDALVLRSKSNSGNEELKSLSSV